MNDKENVCDRYIDEENCTYDPQLWAEAPSSDDRRRTTNGCESFHSHFNALFNSTHPNIFSFLQELKRYQLRVYIYIRTLDTPTKHKDGFRWYKTVLIHLRPPYPRRTRLRPSWGPYGTEKDRPVSATVPSRFRW